LIPQNIGRLFKDTVARFPDKKAVIFKKDSGYYSYSWSEFLKKVEAVASSLLDQGLKPRDKIAIFSENRPEWTLIDLAAQWIGVATVPIYTSLASNEIKYLLEDSDAKIVALSSKTFFEKIATIQKALPGLQAVIGFESSLSLMKDELGIPLILMKDMEKCEPKTALLQSFLDQIGPDTLASIIYTSGTTGVPKGVMLTHSNFIYNAVFSRDALKMDKEDVHLSFLPLSHVFERLAGHYLMIYIGATIAYAESMDTVPRDLLEVRPTFVMGVPRFYEKIKEKVLDAVNKSSSVRKGIFHWAKALGSEKREAYFFKKTPGLLFRLQVALADKLVYQKFRKRLGGRVRFGISGGAALPKEVAEFFYDLGVQIYEGYGLTETSPVMSVNREGQFKFGTVGMPLKEVEVKISEEGEVITKSACVMKGYYKREDETKAVLKEGWFYTGDLGMIDKDGFLVITGRKKEIIVTSGGKKVSPRHIEEMMETASSILRCVLFGEGHKFITALIVPDKEMLLKYADEQKIAYDAYKDLLKNPLVYQWIESRVDSLSKDLANFEKIKYFALLEHDFSQASGELTPTLKVKREVVVSRYKDELLGFYAKDRIY